MTARVPRVLVTRPQPEGAALAADLAAHGFETIQAPMLEIGPVGGPPPDVAGVQAVVLTSAAAARFAGNNDALLALPVYAVGDATAEAASAADFAEATSADGDATDLGRLVAGACDPAAGAILHLSGRAVAGDLGGILDAAGFTLRRHIVYEARPSEALPEAARSALAAAAIDAVLFFSPRSAATFVTLARRAEVAGGCRHALALCISAAVAEAAAALDWRAVECAARPGRAAMADLVAAAFPDVAGKLDEPGHP